MAPPSPTAPSRQHPLRRWKFARLNSSSHPPSLIASCLLRCRSAACLIWAPHSLSPDCAQYVAPSVTVLVVCLSSIAQPGQKGSVSPVSCLHDTRQLHCRYDHDREEAIRLELLEGVPTRRHSTSDIHADRGRSMPTADCKRVSRCQFPGSWPGFNSTWRLIRLAKSKQPHLSTNRVSWSPENCKPKPVVVCSVVVRPVPS